MIENLTSPDPDEGNTTVVGTESQPEEVIPDSPAGAEENDGDPEKPEFGEYEDEASPEHTEEHADFDAGNEDDAASEPQQ